MAINIEKLKGDLLLKWGTDNTPLREIQAFLDGVDNANDVLSANNTGLLNDLRDMLRDDFGMADNRDMAVANAVNDWYLAQFPFLAARADKPNLEAIVAKVRGAQPVQQKSIFHGVKWTDEQIADMIAMAKPPLVFNRIQLSPDERAAIRDAVLEEAALLFDYPKEDMANTGWVVDCIRALKSEPTGKGSSS